MTEVATIPLALHDFVPVALAGLGAYWLATATARRPALLGAGLILIGGLCKASWKLALAVSGSEMALLDDLLFAFMAPGFALLTWGLLRRQLSLALPVGLSALALAGALALGRTLPLLVLAVLGATATGVLAIFRARESGDLTAAWLFGVQLVMAYALVPFAGADQTIGRQWWEQSLNTIGQGAFAAGAWRLLHPSRIRSYA